MPPPLKPYSVTPALKATLATATSVVLWASAFVAIHSAGHSLQAGPLALLGLLVGSLALGAIALFKRREKRPSRRDVVPPLSILMGWLMLGESPTALAVVGGVPCLSGVAVSRLSGRSARAQEPAQERAAASAEAGVPVPEAI